MPDLVAAAWVARVWGSHGRGRRRRQAAELAAQLPEAHCHFLPVVHWLPLLWWGERGRASKGGGALVVSAPVHAAAGVLPPLDSPAMSPAVLTHCCALPLGLGTTPSCRR